ncbi:dephospho-CoA kinase [Parathermosynechococcus lividus]
MSKPLRIGLTGGIACGKSVVAAYLKERYHVPVVDADQLAREAVAIGTPAYDAVVERYGAEICRGDGQLDRPRLGHIIFADPQERYWLEEQIHPWVVEQMQQAIQTCHHPQILLVIPLLFEAHLECLVDQIWVVAVDTATQLARLQQRDGLSTEAAQQRLAAQLPLATKITQADHVIWNTGTLAELYAQVDRLWQQT